MYGGEETCTVWGGKTVGKRPLGKPRHKWKYNIRIDLKEVQWVGVDCISLAQYSYKWCPLVSTSYIKCGEFFD
jgi:hypothetical protein